MMGEGQRSDLATPENEAPACDSPPPKTLPNAGLNADIIGEAL